MMTFEWHLAFNCVLLNIKSNFSLIYTYFNRFQIFVLLQKFNSLLI